MNKNSFGDRAKVPRYFLLNSICLPVLVTTLAVSSASAGVMLDLTGASNEVQIKDGSNVIQAIYRRDATQPTGTGYIDSFVQIQMNGTEKAYNTTVNNVFDNKSADNFNRSITLGSVPIVSIDSIDYREFFLDINENKSSPDSFLSLDDIQIFVGGVANSNVETLTAGGVVNFTDRTLVYHQDALMDNWIGLDYALSSGGSGKGDMILYVANSLFTGFDSSDVLTLYSAFGADGPVPDKNDKDAPNWNSDAGFEEWFTFTPDPDGPPTPGPEVPEPGSMVLWALGLLGLARTRRSRRTR